MKIFKNTILTPSRLFFYDYQSREYHLENTHSPKNEIENLGYNLTAH